MAIPLLVVSPFIFCTISKTLSTLQRGRCQTGFQHALPPHIEVQLFRVPCHKESHTKQRKLSALACSINVYGMLQLKQSLVSLHDIHSPQQGPGGGAATSSPLDAVMTTSAASQAQELVEQLKQEEAQLQQRMVEIDAQLQYAEQVRCRAWWGSMFSCNLQNTLPLPCMTPNCCKSCFRAKLRQFGLGLVLMMMPKYLFCYNVCWQGRVLWALACAHFPNSMNPHIGFCQVCNTGVVGELLTANPSMSASKHILFFC